MNNLFIGACFALLAVALGAFGAHGLKTYLTPDYLLVWETAIKYQFYHALALIIVALWQQQIANKWINLVGIFFIIGIVLFSGSLYALCLLDIKIIGIITPIGGFSFIIGWVCLAIAASKINRV